MPNFEDVMKHLTDATKNVKDENDLKAIGGVFTELDQLKAEEDKMLAAYADLQGKYREAIINSAYKPADPKIENGAGAGDNAPLTMEQCLELVLKQNKG